MTAPVVVETKVCKGCGLGFPVDQFLLQKRHGKREGEAVRSPYCDICRRRKNNEYRFEREDREPGYLERTGRKKTLAQYGMTPEEYDEMFEAQNGLCAVCGKPPSSGRHLVVEHDHDTDEVRGLTCDSCNLGIGLFHNDPDLLIAAAMYLVQCRDGE